MTRARPGAPGPARRSTTGPWRRSCHHFHDLDRGAAPTRRRADPGLAPDQIPGSPGWQAGSARLPSPYRVGCSRGRKDEKDPALDRDPGRFDHDHIRGHGRGWRNAGARWSVVSEWNGDQQALSHARPAPVESLARGRGPEENPVLGGVPRAEADRLFGQPHVAMLQAAGDVFEVFLRRELDREAAKAR